MNHSKPYWQYAEGVNLQQIEEGNKERSVVKSDRQTYESHIEPRRIGSPEDYRSLSHEFDDLIRQEKKLYSRLLKELEKTRLFSGSRPHKSDAPDSSLHPDVGKPPWSEYDVGLKLNEVALFDRETTNMTDAEIRHGCELTMEEVLSERNKSPNRDIGKYSQKADNRYREARRSIESPPESDVSISGMKGQIQNTNRKVFGDRDMKQKIFNRLQLEVGESYSNKLFTGSSFDPPWQHILGHDSTTVSDLTGPLSGWRFRDWHHGSGWQNFILPIHLSAACLAEWNSIMVESVRLILQRWSRVYSFSSTTCCTWKLGEHRIVYRLYTGINKST
jgi:hypothetical protein